MLYKSVDVWKRTAVGLTRYQCFETLPGRRYCVQSADSYPAPFKAAQEDSWREQQDLELLFEQAPDERTQTFATIEEAIAAHEVDFRRT
ncbi:hypothetical protein GCM10022270_23650 [Terriglobus aquaticus]